MILVDANNQTVTIEGEIQLVCKELAIAFNLAHKYMQDTYNTELDIIDIVTLGADMLHDSLNGKPLLTRSEPI